MSQPASKSPLTKGAKAEGLGGCFSVLLHRTHDNPHAVSSKSPSSFAKGTYAESDSVHGSTKRHIYSMTFPAGRTFLPSRFVPESPRSSRLASASA